MLVSCGKQKTEWKGTIEEADGVTVIKNPKEPMYGEEVFSLEKELSIGEAGGREEYMFSEIGTLAVDDEERIYVSDRKETHIKVFDKCVSSKDLDNSNRLSKLGFRISSYP